MLLNDENPIEIDVRPAKVVQVVDEIDKVIESNLKKHKESQKMKK